MDDASPDLDPDAQDSAGQVAPGLAQTTPGSAGRYVWPPMGQITWPPLPAALDAIMTGPQHPSHSDPLVRPWIDLMTPQPRGPGLLDEGLKLLAAQSQSNPATAGQDKISRFQPQTINGVDGLNLRVMTPDETGASATGDPNVVTGSLSRLPPPILQNLRDKGVRWIVVPDSADQGFPDADLASPSQHPKGWVGGADLGDASSMFVPPGYPSLRSNTVVVGTHPGRDHSYNVTLHETGHAHDYNSGMPSMSAAFGAAYGTDAPNMTRPDEATKADLSDGYYLQLPEDANEDRARREAYAEGFARFYGGDPDLQKDWPAMYRYWQDFDAMQRTQRSTK